MYGTLSTSRPRLRARHAIVAAAIVAAVGAAGCGSSSDDTAAPASAPAAATASWAPGAGAPLLGVLSANGGTFADGKLTLTDVDPRAVWFTDRPARQAGTDDIAGFTKLFFAGGDPPNAAVEVAGAPENKNLAVVELSKPAYDQKDGTLSFAAKLVPAGEAKRDANARVAAHPGIADAISRQDGALPATFGAVTVFVDSAETPATTDDMQELRQLAQETTQLEHTYMQAIDIVRTAIEKHPTRGCFMRFEDDLLEVTEDLVGVLPKQIAQLVADATTNGETIPSRDQGLLSTVKESLEGASETAEPLPGELARVQRGQCPY